MTEQEQEPKIIEPLAKFHAKMDKSGRVIIPKYIREVFDIEEDDYLVVIIRIIEIDNISKTVYVSDSFKFSGKVNAKGVIVIPKAKRDEFRLRPGQLLEVLLLDIHRPEDKTPSSSYRYVFLKK